jgi:hypothetical protein
MTFRSAAFLGLLFLLACRNGDCEFGPADEYAGCAQACKPRAMKKFKSSNGGCEAAQCECDGEASDATTH